MFGRIDYLFGKGVGVELALRGEVVGRVKNSIDFPYRSHSDFELYNCNGYDKISESKLFLKVFGAQEWYPKDCTKGLHGIEDGVMYSTYDTVIYKGKYYLVPEFELLFLDKFTRQESTPRDVGCDAFLLMQRWYIVMNVRLLICILIVVIMCLLLLFINNGSNGKKSNTSKQLELTYKTNAGVPFNWEYEIEDDKIVKFVRSYVVKDENKGGIVGAPVYTNYVFKGLKKGRTTITFKYVNFVDGKVANVEKNIIVVDDNNNISLAKNNNK